MDSPLISVEELVGALDRVTVLDVRYSTGKGGGAAEHARGHVPGAAYVDLDRDLAAEPGNPVDARGRHPLPEPEAFVAAMRAVGVSLERPVVVYDDWQGRAAARAWWLLRDYDHPAVRVLDGGWTAWVTAGGQVETGEQVAVPGDFHGRPGAMPLVDAVALGAVDVLVDARAPARFRGEVEPLDPVAGHIPAAVNVDTARNLDSDGRFRPADELEELYASAGATPGTEVAAYCGSGVTATHDILAMEVAGIRAALFPASWSGWVADPGHPVETGPRD